VEASGQSPGGVTVTDLSQNGPDPDPDHNGNAGDNNDPTRFTLIFAIGAIPTLGTWGLIALAMLLGALAMWKLRRRTAA
ncbi:MAG TPA: IPTL-CTERM sorting domain-containing protein, partial [Thermoanaerobaculia bacterium]|nr:IPTL-CTERM sorting domain-containing protein [Thermoanaerobaculia bacterium]